MKYLNKKDYKLTTFRGDTLVRKDYSLYGFPELINYVPYFNSIIVPDETEVEEVSSDFKELKLDKFVGFNKLFEDD